MRGDRRGRGATGPAAARLSADGAGRRRPRRGRRRVARESYGRLIAYPRGALARHRRRRRRARRRVRRRAQALAGRRRSRRARGLAADDRAAPSARSLAPRPGRGRRRGDPAHRLRRAGDGRSRGAVPRRAPEADVRLRPSGDRPGGALGADAADRPRPRCGADRVGVPGRAGDAGAAPGARQDQDPRRRNRLRGAARGRAGRSGWPTCSRRSTPPTAPAGTTSPAPIRRPAAWRRKRSTAGGDAGAARARRRRSVGAGRADRLLPVARRGAPQRRRRLRSARGAGPGELGRRAARGRPRRRCRRPPRSALPARSRSRPRSSRRTPSAGSARAFPMARSSPSTTRWSRSSRRSARASAGPARSARPTAPRPDWPRSRRSPPATFAAISRTGPRSPISPPRPATPRRRAWRASAPSASAPTRRCGDSCCARRASASPGRPYWRSIRRLDDPPPCASSSA